MPNLLTNQSYAPYRRQYAGAPVEEIEKTLSHLDTRYRENVANKQALDILAANTKVQGADQHYKDAAIQKIADDIEGVKASGRWEDAGMLIDQSATDFATDESMINAIESQQRRDAHEAAEREKLAKGIISEKDFHTNMAYGDFLYKGVRKDLDSGIWKGHYDGRITVEDYDVQEALFKMSKSITEDGSSVPVIGSDGKVERNANGDIQYLTVTPEGLIAYKDGKGISREKVARSAAAFLEGDDHLQRLLQQRDENDFWSTFIKGEGGERPITIQDFAELGVEGQDLADIQNNLFGTWTDKKLKKEWFKIKREKDMERYTASVNVAVPHWISERKYTKDYARFEDGKSKRSPGWTMFNEFTTNGDRSVDNAAKELDGNRRQLTELETDLLNGVGDVEDTKQGVKLLKRKIAIAEATLANRSKQFINTAEGSQAVESSWNDFQSRYPESAIKTKEDFIEKAIISPPRQGLMDDFKTSSFGVTGQVGTTSLTEEGFLKDAGEKFRKGIDEEKANISYSANALWGEPSATGQLPTGVDRINQLVKNLITSMGTNYFTADGEDLDQLMLSLNEAVTEGEIEELNINTAVLDDTVFDEFGFGLSIKDKNNKPIINTVIFPKVGGNELADRIGGELLKESANDSDLLGNAITRTGIYMKSMANLPELGNKELEDELSNVAENSPDGTSQESVIREITGLGGVRIPVKVIKKKVDGETKWSIVNVGATDVELVEENSLRDAKIRLYYDLFLNPNIKTTTTEDE